MKTGLQTVSMPQAGLGTWAAGQTTSAEEVEATIEAALETGVRLIDTATVYFNEPPIGKVLKKWMEAGMLPYSFLEFWLHCVINNCRQGEARRSVYCHQAPSYDEPKCCPPNGGAKP